MDLWGAAAVSQAPLLSIDSPEYKLFLCFFSAALTQILRQRRSAYKQPPPPSKTKSAGLSLNLDPGAARRANWLQNLFD